MTITPPSPVSWPTVALDDCLVFMTSGSRGWAQYYAESGSPFLRIQNVGKNKLLLDDIAFVEPPNTAEAQRTIVQSGDVLLSITADLGRTAVIPPGFGPAFVNQHLAILRVKDIDPFYLSAYLSSPNGQVQILRSNRHGVKSGLNFEDIRSFKIPLPPLSEQRRIADVLDRAEALRAKRRAALAELDGLAQSIFIEMFGPPTRIMSNWPTQSLGRFLKFLTSGSRGWAEYYSEMGDLFLRIQNVKRDELSLTEVAYVKPPDTAEANRTKVNSGDVLLSITADIGRTAVVPDTIEKAFISQHLALLRTGGISPRFLSAYLSSESGQEQIFKRNKQGVKAGLNFDDIRSFIVPLPPDTLQQEFVRRVAVVEKLKAVQRASLAELDALFASLQDRAFRGAL